MQIHQKRSFTRNTTESLNLVAYSYGLNFLHEGDEIMITGPTTGIIQMKVKDLHVAGKPANTAVKGDDFTLALEEKIRPSDKLYKLIPENQ